MGRILFETDLETPAEIFRNGPSGLEGGAEAARDWQSPSNPLDSALLPVWLRPDGPTNLAGQGREEPLGDRP